MVKKFPDLERSESASKTGRDHIPPRVFKEMTRLTKQKAKLEEVLIGINAFNAKGKAAEISLLLDKYILAVEQMHTTLKKYNVAFTSMTVENKKLRKKNEQSLSEATQESTLKKLADAKQHRDYEDALALLDRIPKEVLKYWMCMSVVVTGERSGLLSKIYDDSNYNAVFDRCVDVMTKLMLKYGNQILEKCERNNSTSLLALPEKDENNSLDNAA